MKQLAVLLILSVALISCKKLGPKVSVCILDSESTPVMLRCSDPYGNDFDLELPQANNYVCFSPDDTQKLLQACKKGALTTSNEGAPSP